MRLDVSVLDVVHRFLSGGWCWVLIGVQLVRLAVRGVVLSLHVNEVEGVAWLTVDSEVEPIARVGLRVDLDHRAVAARLLRVPVTPDDLGVRAGSYLDVE